MSGELHDNPDRVTGAYSHEFDDVWMIKLLHDDGLLQKLLCRAWLSLNLKNCNCNVIDIVMLEDVISVNHVIKHVKILTIFLYVSVA